MAQNGFQSHADHAGQEALPRAPSIGVPGPAPRFRRKGSRDKTEEDASSADAVDLVLRELRRLTAGADGRVSKQDLAAVLLELAKSAEGCGWLSEVIPDLIECDEHGSVRLESFLGTVWNLEKPCPIKDSMQTAGNDRSGDEKLDPDAEERLQAQKPGSGEFSEGIDRICLAGDSIKLILQDCPCIDSIQELPAGNGQNELHDALEHLLRNVAVIHAESGKLKARLDMLNSTPPKNSSGEDAIPDRLPGMTLPEKISKAMRERQWHNPEKWALTFRDWDDVLDHMQTLPGYKQLEQEKQYVNMYDATRIFVVPWTKGTGCGLAVNMCGEVEHSAQVLLSHSWGEDVKELQQAVRGSVKDRQLPDATDLWFCCFANYQAEDGQGPSVEYQVSLQPFKTAVISAGRGYGMLAVHTTRDDLFTRLWCVHEVDEAKRNHVRVDASFSDRYIEKTLERLDIFISHGFHVDDCLKAAGIGATTVKAQCSRVQDATMLVSEIKSHGGFEELDKTIESFRLESLPSWITKRLSVAKVLHFDVGVILEGLRELESASHQGHVHATAAVVARLKHSNGAVRSAATEALARVFAKGQQEAVCLAADMLEDRTKKVCSTALAVLPHLCHIGDEHCLRCIAPKLKHDRIDVRRLALLALAEVGGRGSDLATELVISCLGDACWEVRSTCVRVLAQVCMQLNPRATHAVIVGLADSDFDVRMAAIATSQSLEIVSEDVVRALAALLVDKMQAVRGAAATTLAWLYAATGEVCVINHIQARLERCHWSERAKLVKGLGEACKQGDVFAISFAMSQLSHHSGALRCAAVHALGGLSLPGVSEVATSIMWRLADDRWEVRRAAAETLARICPQGDLAAASALGARAVDDADADVRIAVVKALVKLKRPKAMMKKERKSADFATTLRHMTLAVQTFAQHSLKTHLGDRDAPCEQPRKTWEDAFTTAKRVILALVEEYPVMAWKDPTMQTLENFMADTGGTTITKSIVLNELQQADMAIDEQLFLVSCVITLFRAGQAQEASEVKPNDNRFDGAMKRLLEEKIVGQVGELTPDDSQDDLLNLLKKAKGYLKDTLFRDHDE
eukprot:TRINITY_DN72360_c0_g1_i1.p1 TRINITY_DN72360_c0_g1~~TRINITY_DN72360_c0_g1_i1.p1  ORF type:complete len:1095 (+),score=224.39 TRINITY_DN72360_c0_g1_i1:45-3287(+)